MTITKEEINQAADFIFPFFKMKEKEIFALFKSVGGPMSHYDNGDLSSLYIRGERENRVLIVAHVDTVWNDSHKIEPVYHNGMFISKNRYRGLTKTGKPILDGIGIGADDRAGIAMLWKLKDLGHSILLVNGEEQGALGSLQCMSMTGAPEEINNHQFVIELDRKGRSDLVFYNVGTEDFAKYCIMCCPGYRFAQGSHTDICVLCEKACGVNISVGYANEHTPNEALNVRWWLRTYKTLVEWLSLPNLQRFEH